MSQLSKWSRREPPDRRAPSLARLLAVARGDAPADLLIRGAALVNVCSGEIHYPAGIAVAEGRVAGLGDYDARETFDARGLFAAPGLIDAHLHVESSLLTPIEFARAVVPRGTTAVVADPHEIANVLGGEGIRYMLDACRGLPLDVFFMLPSCVPSTELETSGARLEAGDLALWLEEPAVLGLAEVMDAPAVIRGEPGMLAKLELMGGRPVDGHAPCVSGKALCAYLAAGIRTDHECTSLDEAREKLRLGARVLVRQGSVAKNLRALAPLLTPAAGSRCGLVSDDLHPVELRDDGHLDAILREAVALGVAPVEALRLVSLYPAEHLFPGERGALVPGRRADVVLFDDLSRFGVRAVFKDGELVARDGRLVVELPRHPPAPRGTMRVGWDAMRPLAIPAPAGEAPRGRVIDIVPGQISTGAAVLPLAVRGGEIVADTERDIVKLAVVERHRATGNLGLGFVRGLGLRAGAIASSVAHDSHNIVAAGVDDADLRAAIAAVAALGGGLVAFAGGRQLAALPLPIAGLMSDEPLDAVAAGAQRVVAAARELGSRLDKPLMTLSFLALPVIPSLRLTDRGLVDVVAGRLVPLLVDQ